MNGKVLKVVEYNLTFGSSARMVNVFGLIRYKKNNGLYVLYADQNNQYSVINYGGSHIKGNTILSMNYKKEDEEIIKEYIFKVTNEEELNDFEVISLEPIEGIEIISSNHLELKPDVINNLIDKTIPKKEVVEETNKKAPKPKKKSPAKVLLILIILLALAIGGIYFLAPEILLGSKESKILTCTITKTDSSLNATLEETRKLSFDYKNILKEIDTTTTFRFNEEKDYQDFINKGTMYKYMPENETQGGFKQVDETNTFIITKNETITTDYDKATSYEEVLLENKREGYKCEEKVLGE